MLITVNFTLNGILIITCSLFPYFVYFSIKYQHSQSHSYSIHCYIGNRLDILQNIVYVRITHLRTVVRTPTGRPIATQITSCI